MRLGYKLRLNHGYCGNKTAVDHRNAVNKCENENNKAGYNETVRILWLSDTYKVANKLRGFVITSSKTNYSIEFSFENIEFDDSRAVFALIFVIKKLKK